MYDAELTSLGVLKQKIIFVPILIEHTLDINMPTLVVSKKFFLNGRHPISPWKVDSKQLASRSVSAGLGMKPVPGTPVRD